MPNPSALLLVEDDPGHAELICRSLTEADTAISVTVAGSLRDARQAVATQPPDLALVDLHLPDGEGNEVVALAAGAFPVVLMTAHGDGASAVQALKAGALDYVIKSPESLTDMGHLVERTRREWQLRQAHADAELALRDSEAKFRTMAEQLLDVLYVTDGNGIYTYLSPAAQRVFGWAPEEMVGQDYRRYLADSDIPRATAAFDDAIREGHAAKNLTFTFKRRDGTTFAGELNGAACWRDGQIAGTLGVMRDITERLRTQTALQDSLREKEALLKEVHHRVKNNLQVISSLLRLQSAQLAPEARAPFKEMQDRVRSMALLHETLYRSGNFAQVDVAAYIKSLCAQLARALAGSTGAIRLQVEATQLFIEVSQVVPIGLLVNELVSNAFKHAFPQERGGEIRVELQPVGDSSPRLRLQVADNGVGLPPDFNLQQLRSLGLQLVSDLAGQLQGQLRFGPRPDGRSGSLFEVVFTPATHNHNSVG